MAMDTKYKDTIEMQQKQFNEESAKVSKLESELYVKKNFHQDLEGGTTASDKAEVEEQQHDEQVYEELCSRLQVIDKGILKGAAKIIITRFHVSSLQSSLEHVNQLKNQLRESQENIDSLEIEKVSLEDAFKRTIKLHEEEQRMMVERVEDLTNKLYVSERSLRQYKERRLSRKANKAAAAAALAAAAVTANAAPTAATGTTAATSASVPASPMPPPSDT